MRDADVGPIDDNPLMPLSAYHLGDRLESWRLSSDEWSELKRSYRETGLTMACGELAVPKTSTRGTRFFSHKSGAHCQLHEGGPESREHIAAKIAVAEAARAIGWDATVEFPAPDRSWIADVLVSSGARRIAIEIQWASQSLTDFERRHARYLAAGIECIWLTTEANARESARTVPHFVLDENRENLGLWLPGLLEPARNDLVDAVQLILGGGIVPVIEVIATHAIVAAQMLKCWNCEKWMTIWRVSEMDLRSRCGEAASIIWEQAWLAHASVRHEAAVAGYVAGAISSTGWPEPAFLKTKHSSIVDADYLALNCPHCRYVQGDGIVQWHYNPEEYRISLGAGIRLGFTDEVTARPHVCRDSGHGVCREPSRNAGLRPFPPGEEHFTLGQVDPDVDEFPREPPRRHAPR